MNKEKRNFEFHYTMRHVSFRIRGFTLIELLVVIAIIALLVSILLPSLATARDLAKFVVCQSNIAQVRLAGQLYSEDNEGRMAGSGWYSFVRPYMGQEDTITTVKAMICPSDPTMGGEGIYVTYDGKRRSYNVNGMLTPSKNRPDIFKLASQTGTIFFLEHQWWMYNTSVCGPSGIYLDLIPADWHPNESVNVAFVDGHVEKGVKVDDLYPNHPYYRCWYLE